MQEGNYDVLEFSMPAQGMNQNIAPDVLPPSFAYMLENITARPLGGGQVRFGTTETLSLPNPESVILKQFPFVKSNGLEQILLYVQEYVHDAVAEGFKIWEDFQGRRVCFSFISPHNAARYVKDTAIKVEYTLNGQTTLYDSIASLTVEGNAVTITLEQNALPREAVLTRVSWSTGTLYSYCLSSRSLSKPLKQNLEVACVPRCAAFMGKLLVCNGVDRVMSWDGNTLEEAYDFVPEGVPGLTRIDNRQFSFVVSPSFDLDNYAVGNLLQIKTNGVTTTLTIAAAELDNRTVTVKARKKLPDFVQGQTDVFYQAWPPRFSYLFAAHDRFWALGEGVAGLAYRHPGEAMRVYYAHHAHTVTAWFNPKTKTVPSLDLSAKHGEPDNLEAICQVGGLLAFMGRKRTQTYQGQSPLPLGDGGDFQFHSLVPTGVIHGDLVASLANDVSFISPNGLQSFGTLNVAKQFAASSLDAVDPLIQQHAASLMASNRAYRSSCSFKYDGGAIAGFKIGQNKVLCSLFSTTLYSWSVFSGHFERATSFLTLGNRLYLSLGHKVYCYADGQDGDPPIYGDGASTLDQDGKELIPFSWTLPVIHLKGRRFANKRYELHLGYPSSFALRPGNQVSIRISGDLPKSYQIENPCRFELRGDLLQSVPLVEGGDVQEGGLGFRLDQPFAYPKDRLKFLASQFWLTVSGYTKSGPLVLKKVKLYGIIERR